MTRSWAATVWRHRAVLSEVGAERIWYKAAGRDLSPFPFVIPT